MSTCFIICRQLFPIHCINLLLCKLIGNVVRVFILSQIVLSVYVTSDTFWTQHCQLGFVLKSSLLLYKYSRKLIPYISHTTCENVHFNLRAWLLLSAMALCRSVRARLSQTSTGRLLVCCRCLPAVLKMRAVTSRRKEGARLAPHWHSWPDTQLNLPTFCLQT